ncbi:MAG: hypothetical protein II737_06605 [Mailhella sp.]|nr:hypothetical protein [Mailhella sp.]
MKNIKPSPGHGNGLHGVSITSIPHLVTSPMAAGRAPHRHRPRAFSVDSAGQNR